ncbi:DegV family protein [Culicoidibacter larvae]|uniref:DegV family protein n=1 Tax=Culicoidibacter larvae TaxID=2579976 RepID=A0A5R8QAR1_9FIRM|nr:DegV family protein [Culicoidibacter larvae]TLG72715.1 DegV family protein [Culicoidibacter larvae]
MKKFAYIMDSTLAVSPDQFADLNVTVQPLYVIVNNQPSKDLYEISATEFYSALEEGLLASTSQPSAGEFLETYERLKADGYTDIFVFTIAGKLSGTNQSAQSAQSMIDGINIHVIDTNTTTAIGSLVVKDVIAFAESNQDPQAVIDYAHDAFDRVEILVYVDNLDALKRGGRISAAQAAIGGLLQIKPLLSVNNGVIEVATKERTFKKAIRKVVELSEKRPIEKVVLLHSSKDDLLQAIEASFKEVYPDITYEVADLSPVVGVHIGPHACGLGILYKK